MTSHFVLWALEHILNKFNCHLMETNEVFTVLSSSCRWHSSNSLPGSWAEWEGSHGTYHLPGEAPDGQVGRIWGQVGTRRSVSIFLVQVTEILSAQIEDLGTNGNLSLVLVDTWLKLHINSSHDSSYRVNQILKDTYIFIYVFVVW